MKKKITAVVLAVSLYFRRAAGVLQTGSFGGRAKRRGY